MHHVGIGAGGRDGEGTANPIIFPLHSEISSSTAALVTTHRNLIIRMIWKYKDVWTKKTLVGLGLGQLLTSTGLTSSELAKKGINAPTSQSFINYVLLAMIYGGIMLSRRQALKAKWYYYVLLGLVDVEANFLVVKSYQYTSITSVMLLDCWAIPCVLFLTWFFLKTWYRFKKFVGVGICIAGLVFVVFSDVHSADRASGDNSMKGDLLVIAGATLYAICNASEAIPFVGFSLAMFLLYLGVPILLKISGSTMLNLSLLTSDMWAALIRIFAYNEKVNWMYYVAFAAVAGGLVVYSGGDENSGDITEHDNHFDEEAGVNCTSQNDRARSSNSGDSSGEIRRDGTVSKQMKGNKMEEHLAEKFLQD